MLSGGYRNCYSKHIHHTHPWVDPQPNPKDRVEYTCPGIKKKEVNKMANKYPVKVLAPPPMAYIADDQGKGKLVYKEGFVYIYEDGSEDCIEWESWIIGNPEEDIEILTGMVNLIKKTIELKKGKK